MNFGLIGAAGYIAPRHMQAIRDTGNMLVAAVDPHDCVGRLDSFFPDAEFFTEIEQFERHLEERRRGLVGGKVDFVSICTPNYLHDSHVRVALRAGANAICEKPLVISPRDLDLLEELAAVHGKRVYSVLQLRLIPALVAMKQRLVGQTPREKAEVELTYVTRRGRWYDVSWKGSPEKSGGVALNIGIHFFDLLLWLFGEVEESRVYLAQPRRMAGSLELQRACVRWFLSTDEEDLPQQIRDQGKFAFRSMTCDDQELEFSEGFQNLHTRVYEEILAGQGAGIGDARPAIELVHRINRTEVTRSPFELHSLTRVCSPAKAHGKRHSEVAA